jgi:hypothetical protein
MLCAQSGCLEDHVEVGCLKDHVAQGLRDWAGIVKELVGL